MHYVVELYDNETGNTIYVDVDNLEEIDTKRYTIVEVTEN